MSGQITVPMMLTHRAIRALSLMATEHPVVSCTGGHDRIGLGHAVPAYVMHRWAWPGHRGPRPWEMSTIKSVPRILHALWSCPLSRTVLHIVSVSVPLSGQWVEVLGDADP